MDSNKKFLSDVIVYSKYSKYLPELQRRETWDELVDRNREMHLEKFPVLEEAINQAYELVRQRKVLPSMRTMQFAGKPIKVNQTRGYNCSYLAIDDYRSFNEIMHLLLSGVGCGYSVQKQHVDKLPPIQKPEGRNRRYVVGDSIEGWADAIKMLMKSYFGLSNSKLEFDFSDIRPKGALLVTSGGKAPGPQPLKECIVKIKGILDNKKNKDKLKPIECHSIICHIADAVLSGGIRRAACISLFSIDDMEMMTCKTGSWWESNPHYGRANNSVALLRGHITKEQFFEVWKRTESSGAGEPGFYWTNDLDMGANPCCFTGDTIVAVADGRNGVTIKQLAEESDGVSEFPVYSAKLKKFSNQFGKTDKFSGWKTEIKNATAFKTGNKKIITITLSNGSEIRCTEDHLFALEDGIYCQAKDLLNKKLVKFFTFTNIESNNDYCKYRMINSFTNSFNRQYRMIWESMNGKKPEGYEIDHIANNGFDGIDNLQLLQYEDHLSKTSVERLGILNSIHKCKNDPIYRNNKSIPSFMESNPNYSGLSDEYLIELGKKCIKDGLELSKKNILSIDPKFPKTFSKNRFGGKWENYVKIVNGEIEYSKPKCKEFIDNKCKIDKSYSEDVFCVNIIDNGEFEDVYDLNVEDNHNFYILSKYDEGFKNSSGVLVHNCEITLKSMQFCNLTEVNVSDIEDEIDLRSRIHAATLIGTLQATYTNFHYLREEWEINTEKDALLGVSLTGISSNQIFDYDIKKLANYAKEINEIYAKILGINPAARVTTVKPSGTASIVLGTSSGIHAWHDKFYKRRIRVGKNESLYTYLQIYHPDLIEDDYFRPHDTSVLTIPIKAPEGATTRNETALNLLQRIERIYKEWVVEGHNEGVNHNNVSATVTIKDNEWDIVGNWMWDNKESYSGLSVLPHDGGSYIQAPFESITEAEYNDLSKNISEFDVTKIIELFDDTDRKAEVACAGGSCEVQ